jgi:hypothetical protein
VTDYPETRLEDFKRKALAQVERGEKAGATICYKGLSKRDRNEARRWMLERRMYFLKLASSARIRLDQQRAKSHDQMVLTWDSYRTQLGTWEYEHLS